MRIFTMNEVLSVRSWLIKGAHTGFIGIKGEPEIFVEIHGFFPIPLPEKDLTFTEIDPLEELPAHLLPHKHREEGGALICEI